MAVTANLDIKAQWTGDVGLDDLFSFVQNAASPGQAEVQDLSSGANTITVPSGGLSTAVGVIIIPPAGNSTVITLKGVGGDTGFALGLVNPSVISLNAVSSFVLDAAGAITGVRLFFF